MGNISRTWALILIGVIAISCASLLGIKPANAQSLPTPSVPEFTLKLVDDSYDVPPTSTVNPYTGKTETSGGYHATGYLEVYIKIKNQPSTSLYYQVQTKGHYSQDWSTIDEYVKEAPAFNPRNAYQEQDYNAQYTVLRYFDSGNLPREGQIDFRVQALVGTPIVYHTSDHLDLYNTFATFSFNGTASGWSDTQTLNLATDAVPAYGSQDPTSNPTTNPTPNLTASPMTSTPTPTPTAPEFTAYAIVLLLVAVFSIALIVRHRKTADAKTLF
jgi:hypothetical protein